MIQQVSFAEKNGETSQINQEEGRSGCFLQYQKSNDCLSSSRMIDLRRS